MLVYRTRLHRRLMEESEKGLFAAIGAADTPWGHIAEAVAYDCRKFTAWESRHARLLEPVAEARWRGRSLAALRRAEVKLVHRRALVETLRERKIGGVARERLFRVFYGPRDYENSVLTEHQQYQLSVASSLAAVRLNEVCDDPIAAYMLEKYESAYRSYFWGYCQWILNENPLVSDMLRVSMDTAHAKTERLKETLCAGRDLTAWEKERMRLRH